MKRILVASLVSMAVASSAFAQSPQPAMMSGYDWNGPYVGINGGGGWNSTHFEYTTPP
jgi:opacity protein-like surface antigen